MGLMGLGGVSVWQDLLQIRSYVYAEEPNIDIHNFVGTFTRVSLLGLKPARDSPGFVKILHPVRNPSAQPPSPNTSVRLFSSSAYFCFTDRFIFLFFPL